MPSTLKKVASSLFHGVVQNVKGVIDFAQLETSYGVRIELQRGEIQTTLCAVHINNRWLYAVAFLKNGKSADVKGFITDDCNKFCTQTVERIHLLASKG